MIGLPFKVGKHVCNRRREVITKKGALRGNCSLRKIPSEVGECQTKNTSAAFEIRKYHSNKSTLMKGGKAVF